MSEFKSSDRIRRAKHEKNYTIILNSTIQDSRLSWKARGLHHYILSLPDDWHICVAHLAEQSEPDGEAIIKSALKELEANGYISKTRVKDDRGRFLKCVWDIYESPQVDFQPTVKVAKRKASKQSPQVDFPQVDKPQVDKPQVENRGLISNDQPSTDLTSTDQQKKESDFFESLPIEQNKSEDIPTPPIAPRPPAPVFGDPMGDRFRDAGNKPKQIKEWQENDLFLRFIHKDLAQKSEYYKNQPYESAKHYIGKSRLSSPDMVLRFEELSDHYQNFLKSQAQRSQQQLTPQLAPPEDNAVYTVPSFVKDFAKSRKAP